VPTTSISVKSSNIAQAEYTIEKKELIITFLSGSRYRYDNVDATTWTLFQIAKSQGVFYNENIKNNKKFPSTKLDSVGGLSSVLKQQSEKNGKTVESKPIHLLSRDFHQLKKS